MYTVILLGLLVIASGNAVADWQKVVSGVNASGYADPTSIKKNGAIATMRVLIDYQKPPFDGNNLPYLSLTMRNEYRCIDQQFRVLTIASHTGNMGQGNQPFKTDEISEWELAASGSLQRELWKVACGKH